MFRFIDIGLFDNSIIITYHVSAFLGQIGCIKYVFALVPSRVPD